MLRSEILPHPPCTLSPGSPLLPLPVQLNPEPRIAGSRCLGRADIFEASPPPLLDALGEVSTEDYVGSFCFAAGRINYVSDLPDLYSLLFSAVVVRWWTRLTRIEGPCCRLVSYPASISPTCHHFGRGNLKSPSWRKGYFMYPDIELGLYYRFWVVLTRPDSGCSLSAPHKQ